MNKQSLDERIEKLMRVAEQATGLAGYGVSPAFKIETEKLLKDVIQEVLPEKMTQDETKDLLWDDFQVGYQRGFNMYHDTINSNLDSLLTGEKE